MNIIQASQNTNAWNFFAWASFIVSVGLTAAGICYLPVNSWIKGYLAMGLFFVIGSAFTLAKTVRDNHEASKLMNRISDAKTEKLLHEFEALS